MDDTNSTIVQSWHRERSTEELQSFVALRHAALPADIDVE